MGTIMATILVSLISRIFLLVKIMKLKKVCDH